MLLALCTLSLVRRSKKKRANRLHNSSLRRTSDDGAEASRHKKDKHKKEKKSKKKSRRHSRSDDSGDEDGERGGRKGGKRDREHERDDDSASGDDDLQLR